ncbi:hypothetical protein EG328_007816 [Venturia inaequalis]|nr:hypothetical protein EG328_007816 [Venturia inaequalis]
MLDGGAFTAINTTFKFVEFCYAIGDVPEESLVFIRLIQRVRDDLDECLRLLTLLAIRNHLECDPDQKRYISGTIQDTKSALSGIGKYVEGVRTEEERNGEISLRTRFEWILRHQCKLQSRQVGLDTCHKSLLQAMSRLILFMHTAAPTGGPAGLSSHKEAINDKGGLTNATRTDAKSMSHDELTDFLTTRNRRTRPVKVEPVLESTIDILAPGDIERPPPLPPKTLERPVILPLARASKKYTPNARVKDNQSYLHPNAAELGCDIARPSTAASNMTGSTYLDEPFTAPRLRSFSSSSTLASTLASTVFTISSDATWPEKDTSSFLSGPPTQFFAPERPRSSYGAYSMQHRASSSASGIEQFGMRPQFSAHTPVYHTHHTNFSVGSGISDMSLQSSTYSTLHENPSVVSGFSELPAQSPRQERSYSNLAPKSNRFYPWTNDPGANAPELVLQSQTKTPIYVAYSPAGPPSPLSMPDYSIPEVVPVEHESHFESLPQLTAHAPLYSRRSVGADLESALQSRLQLPSPPPQRILTPAQERREKTRARLNLIAGEW